MIADRFFSPARFREVCKKDLLESWKTNLWRFVILYAVLATFIVLFYLQGDPSKAIVFSLLVFAVMGCAYASSVMEKMSTREKRIAYLMLPATSFEKYLSRLLYSLVLYTAAFIVAFGLADLTGSIVAAVFSPFGSLESAMAGLFDFLSTSPHDGTGPVLFTDLVILYFFFHSCFILGGNIWYKHPFPKTIAALLVMLIIYAKVVSWSAEWFTNDRFLHYAIRESTQEYGSFMYGVNIVLVVITLFNWTLAYYRFKEAEVVNRII